MSSDELQQKLISLKAKQEKGAYPSDPRISLERKKYYDLYSRIYPSLQRTDFDFSEVAYVAGLKERRMRDALISRLALADMMKLFGHTAGSCYVCGSRIRGFYVQEPFCMTCLSAVDTAIHTLYPPEETIHPVISAPRKMTQAGLELLNDLLACGAPLMAITGDPLFARPDVLNVLYKSDAEIDDAEAEDEISVLLQLGKKAKQTLSPDVDLRHFGFQRPGNARD